MADKMMKTLVLRVFLVIVAVCLAVVYLQMRAEHKQAQRELEYRMAHQRIAAEKAQRVQEWQRNMQQERLRQQYSQGRVVGGN